MILHSQILGTGKPFVILHGFLGMSDNWKTLGMRWSEVGYEVHLLDQRNHGRSFHSDEFSYDVMVEDLKRYCEEHNLEEIILLGHSMGGKVAMQFAVTYPNKVSNLIIADISPKAYPSHHQDILKALHALDFTKIKSRGEADDALSEYIRDQGTRLFLLKNLYRNSNKEFALRINLPILSEKIEEVGVALPKNTVFEGHTLFLGGEKSGYIETMDELLIKKHFPNAEIKMISNAGHWLHAENPDDFYDATMSFLQNG
ncbi:alpha/beta fold hydrolase [Aequorivita viscosa]|uniref:Pimeloyl-ACP methyl ester carboxylesterase n=1 Tax=Aequorivita viscosa TaxID=797419 RepID=A0A1M6A9K4_9FLAO|nr:alpha/beta fold hydrolase [Aequorivita viscosa]SDW13316.1 Pimeloyl-ACP methyl ester carboxylesterase [Aequorivita viscosa]SHI33141.1 Pimeloyl-ACP methyl ester carboxylesterase [Aequorivita viscosa]